MAHLNLCLGGCMWKTCQVKCGGLCRTSRSGAGGSRLPRGRLRFSTCMIVFVIEPVAKRFRCWVVDGSFYRLPCCQVQCEGGSGAPAYGWERPSRAKTEWEHVACADSAPKGWGRIQRIYLAYKQPGTVPKWTARKKAEVIRKFGPWMDFWMLKGIRSFSVHKIWTRFVIDRDWCRFPKGTPGPRGLRTCVSVCRMLTPGQKVPGFRPKKRHQAAWTYGRFLSKKLVKKLLDY